jgi:hypothetical protein
MMNKKRLTLLLTDAQIRIIKSKAAMAGMTGSQWVIEQLNLDTTLDDQDTPQADATPYVDPDPQADDAGSDAQAGDAAGVGDQADVDHGTSTTALADLVPDYTGRKMEKPERDKILLALDASMPENNPETLQVIVDLLTKNSIPSDPRKNVYAVAWTPKKFKDTLSAIKRRAKKKTTS